MRLSHTRKGEAHNYYPSVLILLVCFSFSVSQLCCPYMCPIISLQRLRIRSTHHRRPQTQRITLNTSIHHTVHIYTPVCFVCVLFCFVSHSRSVSVRSKISLTRQNMSHKTEHVGHWEGLEMWLSVTTDSILPKAAEALRHQTQDQLDDNNRQ